MTLANLVVERFNREVKASRQDVARAKAFAVANVTTAKEVSGLAREWLQVQGFKDVLDDEFHGRDQGPPITDALVEHYIQAGCLRLALLQGIWELIAAGLLLPHYPPPQHPLAPTEWVATFRGFSSSISCPHPTRVVAPPLRPEAPADLDIFLHAPSVVANLHPGIAEGVHQSLACFHRGLYLPAIVMLAAATEGLWRECAKAVATKTGDTKLASMEANPSIGIGKLIEELRKKLVAAGAGGGPSLLQSAKVWDSRLNEAVAWTTILREKRNALHWGKGAAGFIAQHAEAAGWLMGAPQHFGTIIALS